MKLRHEAGQIIFSIEGSGGPRLHIWVNGKAIATFNTLDTCLGNEVIHPATPFIRGMSLEELDNYVGFFASLHSIIYDGVLSQSNGTILGQNSAGTQIARG